MLEGGVSGPQSYDSHLQHALAKLGREVLNMDFNPTFREPRKYTGNLSLSILVKNIFCFKIFLALIF
jgi:hypothetical protein